MSASTETVYCHNLLKSSGSSFSTAFMLLPRRQREAMTAFYAFCRAVDDAADGKDVTADMRGWLLRWRCEVEGIYAGRPWHPVAVELRRAVSGFGIKRAHLEEVIDGVEADLDNVRYETFAELYDYCFKVASAVGLVCVTVLGESSPEVELYAELTGIAVQL
ncbi:MAG: squalene/phytoene synthase family protein, partial [Myxococcota bacterium]